MTLTLWIKHEFIFKEMQKRGKMCEETWIAKNINNNWHFVQRNIVVLYSIFLFFFGKKTMEKLRTARLNKHKRQGRFLLISNLNGEFPQNTIGKCKFHYSTILEMWWPLFHWISHLRWILLNSREMKSEHLLDRITHSPAIEH